MTHSSLSFLFCPQTFTLLYIPPHVQLVMTATTEEWTEANVAEPPTVEIKLFGRWNPDEIHVNDISLAVSC